MRVTIYVRSEILGNIVKIEATDFAFEVKVYAQYPAAVHAAFRPKGCRRLRGMVQAYSPSMLVLEGWNHPDPPSAWKRTSENTERSLYSSCDPRWQTDFDAAIAAHIAAGARVVADFRKHNSHRAVA